MTTKIREYVFKIPFTIDQWRKGQRYVLAKHTTDETQILDIKQRKENGALITETRKILDLSKRLPTVLKKLMKENALFVEEFSTNIDVIGGEDSRTYITKKSIKTDGLLKEMDVTKTEEAKMDRIGSMEMQDGEDRKVNLELSKDYSSKDHSSKDHSPKDYSSNMSTTSSVSSTTSSTCETSYVSKHYDTDTFSLTIKTHVKSSMEEKVFSEEGKRQEFDFTNGKEAKCYIYKLLKVTINSMIFGWVTDKVKNSVRDMLNGFCLKVIESENEWKDLTEEELVKIEEEMIKKFLKKE